MTSSRFITSAFALRYFATALAVCAVAGAIGFALAAVVGARASVRTGAGLPPAFAGSTFLLFSASVNLQRGLGQVRLERQRSFRRALRWALACGTGFVAVQATALRMLFDRLSPGEAQTSAYAFGFVFAALHGLHVIVALLVLVFVFLQASADRYDHEYAWGVTFCTYFWHALGLVWLCILVVLSLAA